MKLIPFGLIWVDKLGEAFFALNEDRKYLPNIVARLSEEAELAAQEAERAEALQWLARVSNTADGETTNEESIAILIELRARGYRIAKESDGTISVSRDSGTSYLRSNGEILGLGKLPIKSPRN